MTIKQMKREAIKRGLWLAQYKGGYLLSEMKTNTLVIPYEGCTLETCWDYMKGIDPEPVTDEEADNAIERHKEWLAKRAD